MLHLHVLPVLKGATVYTLKLWGRWETLLAVTAAALCQLFPVVQRCAAVFGHPKHKGKRSHIQGVQHLHIRITSKQLS